VINSCEEEEVKSVSFQDDQKQAWFRGLPLLYYFDRACKPLFWLGPMATIITPT
jgi:hypothetical protein